MCLIFIMIINSVKRKRQTTIDWNYLTRNPFSFNIRTQIATLTEWFEHSLTFFHCVLSSKTRFDVIFGVSILCSERFFYSLFGFPLSPKTSVNLILFPVNYLNEVTVTRIIVIAIWYCFEYVPWINIYIQLLTEFIHFFVSQVILKRLFL